MNKRNTIFISILLVTAGVIISYMGERTDGSVDIELTDFFAGILFGGGSALLIKTLYDLKKNRQ